MWLTRRSALTKKHCWPNWEAQSAWEGLFYGSLPVFSVELRSQLFWIVFNLFQVFYKLKRIIGSLTIFRTIKQNSTLSNRGHPMYSNWAMYLAMYVMMLLNQPTSRSIIHLIGNHDDYLANVGHTAWVPAGREKQSEDSNRSQAPDIDMIRFSHHHHCFSLCRGEVGEVRTTEVVLMAIPSLTLITLSAPRITRQRYTRRLRIGPCFYPF